MSNETTLRFPGIKVSDLLRGADEHGMWQVSTKEFSAKVKEMTQGSETFAEKYLDAKPSNYFFLSHSWSAERSLGALIALVGECLDPDDTVFIDLFCWPQHDNSGVFTNLLETELDMINQCRGLLAPIVLDDETLQLSHSEIRAIKSWSDAPAGLQYCPFARGWCIPELYGTALSKKPIVIAFGRASRGQDGRTCFVRVQNAVLFDKIGKLANFENAQCSNRPDKEKVWKILLGIEASRGVTSSEDGASERVHRLLESAAQGAIVSSEWPKVQKTACRTGRAPISEVKARRLARSIDSQGRTALMAAAAAGYKNVVDAILSIDGVDVDAADASGKTAAAFASLSHVPSVLEAILAKSAAPAPAAAHGEYLVFLSHKQTDAKDFARALHAQFTLRGLPTFLDMEFKEELNDLEAIVATIPNFIFILSDNVFESTWCLKELASAVRSKANIIMITKEGARWAVDEGGPRDKTFPPYSLIESLPEEVKPAFTSKAIAHSDEYYQSFIDGVLARIKTPNGAGDGPAGRLGRAKPPAAAALAGPQLAPASAIDLSGLQDKLSLLVDAQLDLVGELRAQRGAAAKISKVATPPSPPDAAAAADLEGALNAAINAYFALAEPRPDAKAFVAAQLQM